MMDEDDRPDQSSTLIGKPLDSLSIEELESYQQSLRTEIERVEAEKKRKQDVKLAAERLFANKG